MSTWPLKDIIVAEAVATATAAAMTTTVYVLGYRSFCSDSHIIDVEEPFYTNLSDAYAAVHKYWEENECRDYNEEYIWNVNDFYYREDNERIIAHHYSSIEILVMHSGSM